MFGHTVDNKNAAEAFSWTAAHPDPEGKQLKVLQNCHPDSNTAPDWSKKFRALRAKRSGDFHFYHFLGNLFVSAGCWRSCFSPKDDNRLVRNWAFSLGIPYFYILLTVAGTAKLLSYKVCRGSLNVGWTSWTMPPHSFMVSSRNCHSAACE